MINNQLKEFICESTSFIPICMVKAQKHEVIYTNKAMDGIIIDDKMQKCWELIYGEESKCSWCPLDCINVGDTIEYEHFNKPTNKWYKLQSKHSKLDNNEDILISMFIDITHQKKVQKQLTDSKLKITKQAKKFLKLNKKLDKYKNFLEIRVEEEIEKRKNNEKILFQQSRLASMGEMIDAIAHQWKQPLTTINAFNTNLKFSFEFGKEITPEYIDRHHEGIQNQIFHMTDTLDEFRSFFRPSKNQAYFDVKNLIDNVLSLVKDIFLKHNINVKIIGEDKFKLYGVENEFKHIFLNLLNNAKDAFEQKDIKNKNIIINLKQDDKYKYIEVSDNAGGIDDKIIADIFKANITTKEEEQGTGIGLYMSSQIAQKHNGALSVKNIDNGAKFTFKTKK